MGTIIRVLVCKYVFHLDCPRILWQFLYDWSALMQYSFSKLFKRIQCKINISLLLMQTTIANATCLHQFCIEPMIYLCCIITLKIFLNCTYSYLEVFRHVPHDKGTTLWCGTHVWSYLSSVSRSSGMTFGWHIERDCVMDIRRMFLIKYIGPLNSIPIVFSDPTPVFSNFHTVLGLSLECNAAIFIECYPERKLELSYQE